ncbi:pyruvate dehydrogenase complex dihydrolipoamide acetyltransferase [Sedimenticola selenatireducens]|uniref:Acetyltransferase component of pyruvate dehydrogenase complex n=1 Tax=Sedimenticola selenatireducens TaxID=191960 RepID=A0A2N6CWD5_9GAMM|nr:pyruvate dehydrogenase complex dihydrolipoamide acetyltransferase [Sedimenticola selenatireducens]PLX61579.1 MAG: pyruvate dehydrogenase complex dihydrolipoamide acetyltransferase [Sedimenticola selenatireducens]
MPIEILLPALTADMTETRIYNWLVSEGSKVNKGDVLLEIETDKAVVEVESEYSGKLGKILIGNGEIAKVDQCIAVLLEDGEINTDIDRLLDGNKYEDSSGIEKSSHATTTTAAQDSVLAANFSGDGNKRIFASPLARRIAQEHGIDLLSLNGTGPHNRIVKNDIVSAIAHQPQTKLAKGEVVTGTSVQTDDISNYDVIPNSGMRKVIAKRLGDSKRDVPHFYLTVDLELDALLALRRELNERTIRYANPNKLSVNDLVIKASALALRDVPDANSSWTEDAIHRYHDVDIAIAVATESGLITPIIRNADQKGLSTISNEMKTLAEKARNGKLQPHEYQGGGFTISNLGMFGIKSFSAIVNPPQSCILAVGAGEQRAVVKDGELAVATAMTCTLSVDHRSVDGAIGAHFLKALKAYIEDPMAMML